MASDLARAGLVEEAETYARRPTPLYEYFPENQTIIEAFLNCDTQWVRVAVGMASIITEGLNYCALKSTLEMMGIKRRSWPDVLEGVRVMENAALSVIRERESNRG